MFGRAVLSPPNQGERYDYPNTIDLSSAYYLVRCGTKPLQVEGEVRFDNDVTIGKVKCNHCDNTSTISTKSIALCLDCINSVVIFHTGNAGLSKMVIR